MSQPQESYSILMVEDEEKIAKILTTYLKLYPKFKSIIWAKDGVEAMQKLSNQEFDLIITDLVLPRRDGLTFLDTLRKIPRYMNQKVIVISGCLTADLTMKCIQRNVKHIVVKPFTARQILLKSIGVLKAEENTKKVVDSILEKVARRFLLRNLDTQQAILNQSMSDLASLVVNELSDKDGDD